MADSKISQLEDGGLPTAGDKFPIARDGKNFSIDGSKIVNTATIANVYALINSVSSRADAAYSQASASTSLSIRLDAAYGQANAAYALAQSAQAGANTANSALGLAQAAFNQANTALGQANNADTDAFRAWATANAALAAASSGTTALTLAQAAYNQANASTTSANQAYTLSQGAIQQAATATASASGANTTANSAYSNVGSAYNRANAAYALAQQAYTRATATAGSVSGVNGVPRLSNYMIAQIDFDDLMNTATASAGTAGITTSPTRGYWAKAVGISGTKVTTDLTGASGGTNVLAGIPNTFFNAAQCVLGPLNNAQAHVGVVNLAGGTTTPSAPSGSVGMNQGVSVAKLFQNGMLHSLRGSLSIYASKAAIQGRVIFGFNTWTNNNSLESGVWFETTVNDTNWWFVYTTGEANSGGATQFQNRIDTGVPATYSALGQFTRFRLDWDGTKSTLTGVINDVQVAQIGSNLLPTNCPYAQGIAGADCRLNQTLSGRSSSQGTTTAVLVDSMEFVGYWPNGRVGW